MSMKARRRIVSALRDHLSPIDTCLSRIYSIDKDYEMSGQREPEDEEYRARLEGDLAELLREVAIRLAISLDMLQLRDTRLWFVERWKEFTDSALATADFIHDDESDDVRSLPYNLIRTVVSTLESTGTPSDESAGVKAKLEVLRSVLLATAKIVNASSVVVDREKAVRDIMHQYLQNVFPDYSPDEKAAKILKPIKSFVPDAVIHSLRAAIEFKYVDNEAELKTAYDGILTDLSAYNDAHWHHYYSVIYMTGPYETELRFNKAVELSGHSARWTQIVVNGPGARAKRAAKIAPGLPIAGADSGEEVAKIPVASIRIPKDKNRS